MRWVIQTNIFAEEGYEELLAALDRLELQKTLVKVVPFVGDLEVVDGALPPDHADAIVMGSYSLAKAAVQRSWRPGAFLENLDFQVQRIAWGDRMLNADSRVFAIKCVSPQPQPFFIRPVFDTKSFTGYVSDWPSFTEWRDRIVALPAEDNPTITPDTLVQVCTKKEIWSETRTWIVNGRIVTASGYKVGTIKRYTRPNEVDQRITDFAEECAGIWCPNKAFVLDVADTPDGLKIVEINNLNSAGWYKADLQRLIFSLEELSS